jgi:hypothetical protein
MGVEARARRKGKAAAVAPQRSDRRLIDTIISNSLWLPARARHASVTPSQLPRDFAENQRFVVFAFCSD